VDITQIATHYDYLAYQTTSIIIRGLFKKFCKCLASIEISV